jgi:hypothetical protein
MCDVNTLIQIGVFFIVLYFVCGMNKTENLCVRKSYGIVTDVPMSNYTDANMALVHSTSLGQAPLGDPQYWLPSSSPITQGQYGLYQPQPFNEEEYKKASMALPKYNDTLLPLQYTPVN